MGKRMGRYGLVCYILSSAIAKTRSSSDLIMMTAIASSNLPVGFKDKSVHDEKAPVYSCLVTGHPSIVGNQYGFIFLFHHVLDRGERRVRMLKVSLREHKIFLA